MVCHRLVLKECHECDVEMKKEKEGPAHKNVNFPFSRASEPTLAKQE